MSRGGCLVDELEYCKECYKAELIERANRKEMYEEAAKAAKAECNKCRKPFTGIFRKKRYAVKGHGNMRNPTEFLCKDCFLALPKNDPWDGPPERIASDLWGQSLFDCKFKISHDNGESFVNIGRTRIGWRKQDKLRDVPGFFAHTEASTILDVE